MRLGLETEAPALPCRFTRALPSSALACAWTGRGRGWKWPCWFFHSLMLIRVYYYRVEQT